MAEELTRARVLPADVFDALEFSALAAGGIGAGFMARDMKLWVQLARGEALPWCGHGHGVFLDGNPRVARPGRVLRALRKAGIGIRENDVAVANINRRKGSLAISMIAPVAFAAWCAELHVHRGA